MNTKDYIDEELKELLDVEKNRYFQLLEMQNILDIKEHMDIVAFKELQNYYKGMETYDTKERACVKIELYNFFRDMMINELNAINDIRLCLEFQMRALKDISQLRREKKTLCRRIKYGNSDRIFVTKNEKRDIEIVKKLIEKYKSKVKVYEKWEESILNIDIFNEEERKFVLEKFEGFKITIEDGLEESINAYEIISLLSSLRFFE